MGVFDIIGPVMIGPSSSHTAGAVKIGRFARALLGETPVRADIGLHGSFAATGKGHGTDLALIGGILGFAADDPRIREAAAWAAKMNLSYSIAQADLGPEIHPNAARITLLGAEGKSSSLIGTSVGGGEIEVVEVDGFELRLTGSYDALLVAYEDTRGVIAAVSRIIADHMLNIAQMTVRRKDKGEQALMVVEVDQPIPVELVETVTAVPEIETARFIPRD